MHVRPPRAQFSALRMFIARKRDAYERREESRDAERLVNVTQIFTTISPCLLICFLRGLKNGVSVGKRTYSISRRIISAQFRRSVYIIRVRRASRPYKSSCLFLCILATAISFLAHAEITV